MNTKLCCKDMGSSEWLHVKLSQFLLECFGLWPYQLQAKKRRNYLIFAMSTLSLILPLTEALKEMPNLDVILYFGTIAAITYLIGGFYLATIMYMKPHRLTKLYEQIKNNLNVIILQEELEIMDQFSRQAGTLIFIFTGMAILAISMFITFNYLPLLYPTTQGYTAMFSVYSNRWIIHEKIRRIQVIAHITLMAFYTALVYVVNVSVYISSVKHTCGMYAIVSYRLRKLMRVRTVTSNKKITVNEEILAEMMDVITKHREAIKSTRALNGAFSRISYIVQIGAQICFAILIFALQLSFSIKSSHLALRVFSMGTVFIVFIFYLNYGGEQIIEFSNRVFMTTYFVNWHLMAIKPRKILLMIILRSSKGDTISGGTMVLSLRNFATIMYISWSMAAVLLSTQKDVA